MELFEQYRPLLFAIAYRMLGSVMEAEDILQDAYLRFQTTPPDQIEHPKAFLSTIVTRLCLNHLNSARVQRESYLGPWLPEPVTSAAHPELTGPAEQVGRYDSISMAFLVLLERLTPAERAVFLLREVFDYPYAEIAQIVDKSEAACRQLLSRAKKYIADNRPRYHTTPQEHRQILEHFITAVAQGELEPLTDLLAEEVTFWEDGGGKVRGAAIHPVVGRVAVARFVLGTLRFVPADFQFEMAEINGQPATIIRTREGRPMTVIMIEVGDGRVQAIRAIANPDKLKYV